MASGNFAVSAPTISLLKGWRRIRGMGERHLLLAVGDDPIPMISTSTAPASPEARMATSSPTISSARACRGSGRSASVEPVPVTGFAANLQSADGSRTPPTALPSYPSPAGSRGKGRTCMGVHRLLLIILLLNREYFPIEAGFQHAQKTRRQLFGTEPRYDSSTRLSAVEGKAAVGRTDLPFVLMTDPDI